MSFLQSQARALFSLRATWIYLGIICLGMAGIGFLVAFGTGKEEELVAAGFLVNPGQFALLVMVFGAAMLPGADLTKGTLGWCYLSTNHRFALLLSQVALLIAAFSAATVLGAAVSVLLVLALGYKVDFALDKEQWQGIATVFSEWIVFSILAVLLTYIFGRAVYAVMLLVLDLFLLEMSLNLMPQEWAHKLVQLLPMRNTMVMALGAEPGEIGRLGATLIIVTLIALLGAAAWRITDRRAVN